MKEKKKIKQNKGKCQKQNNSTDCSLLFMLFHEIKQNMLKRRKTIIKREQLNTEIVITKFKDT